MKIQNQTTKTLVLSDVLADEVSQYQSGVKNVTLAPKGSAGDSIELPNSIAGESVVLQALMASGDVLITGTGESLGGRKVPGVLSGGGPAFNGLVRTQRLEAAVPTFRIMFGTPDPVLDVATPVDLVIGGYKVAAPGDIAVSADALMDLIGVTTHVVGAAASGKVIVTFTSASVNSQAAYTIWAPQA